MSKVKMFVAAMVITAVSTAGLVAKAADPAVMASEVVEYRLTKWKTAHADGKAKTDSLVKTLKKLRCEVQVGSHGGHSDVKYRCSKWQKLALNSHKAAHQWEGWLKKHGFETKHAH